MSQQNISLNGLRVFEAASRHLSFTQAATELHITQAAVSQQIRRLEDQLGLSLFERRTPGLLLLPAGEELAKTTRLALNNIFDTIDRITIPETKVLTISMLPSFASRWLIPRLPDFQSKYKDIQLHIHTSNEKVNLLRGKVDAAIRLAAFDEPNLRKELIIPDAMCLVCNPILAATLSNNIDDLYNHTLAVDGNQVADLPTRDITNIATNLALKELKLDKLKLKMMVFDQSDNVVLFALTGQGVALTRLSLCADELAAGHLKIVFEYCKPLTQGYSFVYPQASLNDSRLLSFKQWLQSEAKTFKPKLLQFCPDLSESEN